MEKSKKCSTSPFVLSKNSYFIIHGYDHSDTCVENSPYLEKKPQMQINLILIFFLSKKTLSTTFPKIALYRFQIMGGVSP